MRISLWLFGRELLAIEWAPVVVVDHPAWPDTTEDLPDGFLPTQRNDDEGW